MIRSLSVVRKLMGNVATFSAVGGQIRLRSYQEDVARSIVDGVVFGASHINATYDFFSGGWCSVWWCLVWARSGRTPCSRTTA